MVNYEAFYIHNSKNENRLFFLINKRGGQKNELLLNLIFPDHPDGNGDEDENCANEKETANASGYLNENYKKLYEGCAEYHKPKQRQNSGCVCSQPLFLYLNHL